MARLALLSTAGLLALALAGGNAQSESRGPKAPRFEVLAHVEPGDGATTADVFARDGYAYLSSWRGTCTSKGVRVYDMRNPRRPVKVSSFADAQVEPEVAGSWSEKTIVQRVSTGAFVGTLAVTSFQSCRAGGFQGFGLYDVTVPEHPRRLSLQRTDPRGSHEIWLQPARGRAYVYTAINYSEQTSGADYDPKTGNVTIPGKPDFRIFDVSDPGRPAEVGSWGAWVKLGVHPTAGRGFFKRNFVHSVIGNAKGTRAYLSYWDLGTVILDVTRPADPRYLGRTPPASNPEGDVHSAALGQNGKLLVETQESRIGTARLFDISNERKPRFLRELKLPGLRNPVPGEPFYIDSVHDPKVRGKTAYFSWYRQGVVAADISKPGKARVLARFLPPAGQVSEPMFWGVFAEPGKDYVLASDFGSGLWVVRFRR